MEKAKVMRVQHNLFLFFFISTTLSAAPFVDLDFETPATGLTLDKNSTYPEWGMPNLDNTYGKGNFFEVVDHAAHTGTHSLKFSYTGRNGFCNTCGTKAVQHQKGLNNVKYLVAKDGQDLTLEREPLLNPDGSPALNRNGKQIYTELPHAAPGRIVYNTARGHSKWKILTVENENAKNDKLTLELLQPGIPPFDTEEQVINGNELITITRKCGVDGISRIIGGQNDLSLRSNCDTVIMWFGKQKPLFQPSGTSIFRRVYIKPELVDPPEGHKLSYVRLLRAVTENNQTGRDINKLAAAIILVAENNNGVMELKVDGLGKVNPAANAISVYRPGNGLPEDAIFEPNTWHYIEQEFKAEDYTITTTPAVPIDGELVTVTSYKGQGNGEYRLWFAKAGEETSNMKPVIELTGLNLPPIIGGKGQHMSLWGNIGNHKHTRGSWYIDDFKIDTKRINFIPADHVDTMPSKPPKTN